MENSGKYYARTNEEKKFDSELREKIAESGSPSEMALYIQNQAILSMLRRLEETIDTAVEDQLYFQRIWSCVCGCSRRGCKDYE